MESHRKLSRKTKGYKVALEAFRKQFKDVVSMTRVYINDQNKVYSGEWIDSKGVVNFNGGFAPDVVTTIEYVD